MPESSGYLPIRDYALIGNCTTTALVGRNGSIDWCCLPDIDSPSVFGAILDAEKGGRFRISPAGRPLGTQHYIEDTNVVNTRFTGETYDVFVTDLMPVNSGNDGRSIIAPVPAIHRILRCASGEATIEVEWSPRFDYARVVPRIELVEGVWVAHVGTRVLCLTGAEDGTLAKEANGVRVRYVFRMQSGDERAFVTSWGEPKSRGSLALSLRELGTTVYAWQSWAYHREVVLSPDWAGPWYHLVVRSALVLKLLTHADTGAIAAAPTTSLPETIGGIRNWDYRYSWIRDGSLIAQALISIGHTEEAIEFLVWMENVAQATVHGKRNPQIMYGIHGESALQEMVLDHLEGYRGSAPVRVGNAAASQRQLEVYGELINTAYELLRRDVPISRRVLDFVRDIADRVYILWREPDHGIWEVRGDPRHFTYSKVMCWVAMDRAILLAERCGLGWDAGAWRQARDEIHAEVLEKGYDPDVGAFVISFGSKDLDAANLRIPLLGFLPFDDFRVQGTIDSTQKQLMKNGMVFRYNTDDNLPGDEGAFNICTFWLVDVLALSGRINEARTVFEAMVSRANHVGLYSEQIDPATCEFLGNFPQAFSHLGLINSFLHLAFAEGKDVPWPSSIGSRSYLGSHAA